MSTPLLEFQLTGSFNLLDSLVNEISDKEWTLKVNRRANMVGFTIWHCLRTIDWTIHRVAARRNELVARTEWRDVRPDGAFFGAGVTMEAADRVARTVNRDRTRDYLSALRTERLAWLRETSDEDLDRLVDLNALASDDVWHRPLGASNGIELPSLGGVVGRAAIQGESDSTDRI